jgi:Ca2+-binding RTX toxin-like protein
VHVERLTGTSATGQTLTGNSRANAVFGGAGNDVLNGGGGNDLIDGGAGDDRMAGGTGDDVYFVDSAGDVVVENAGEGTDEVRTTLSSYTLPAHVETLTYIGTGAFTATGSGGNDRIRGGSGDDMLSTGAGNDILNLSDGGDDVAEGGSGEDIFFYGAALTGADRNDGGAGTDTLVLQGRYSGLVLAAASLLGIEGISLQSGSITRWGEDGTASYDYDLRLDEANTAPGQQLRINAQSLLAGEDFRFDGSKETDGGRFLVYAGFGTDLLTGGSGNDIFYFEAGRLGAGDQIVGGAGNDAVVISGVPTGGTTLVATIAAGTLTSVESLSVNGRFATDLSARPSYELVLENGNAAVGARLIVNGSSLGADQSLAFDGSRVEDALLNIFGGAGADRLTGGANADALYAGGGADLLTGGGGADLFQYRSVSDSTAAAPDRILDFVRGTDRIDLSQVDADSAAAGDQGFAFIGNAAFSGLAGQLRSAFVGPNLWRVEGDVDGDRVADLVLEVVGTAGQSLTASDFLL